MTEETLEPVGTGTDPEERIQELTAENRRLRKQIKRMREAAAADNRPYHHGDLRRALIDAATQLVTEGGSAALTVRAAAQAAALTLRTRLEPGAKVLVVGAAGLRTAVTEQGFVVVDSADDHPAAVVQGFGPLMRGGLPPENDRRKPQDADASKDNQDRDPRA